MVGPLSCITPETVEILFDEEASWGRAVISTNNTIDVCILPSSSVFAALTNSQHSKISLLVIMEILSIITCCRIWIISEGSHKVKCSHLLRTSTHRSYLKELPIFSIVELEYNTIIILIKSRCCEDGKMTKIDASSPPNVIDLTSDKRQAPNLLLLFFWLFKRIDCVSS